VRPEYEQARARRDDWIEPMRFMQAELLGAHLQRWHNTPRFRQRRSVYGSDEARYMGKERDERFDEHSARFAGRCAQGLELRNAVLAGRRVAAEQRQVEATGISTAFCMSAVWNACDVQKTFAQKQPRYP